MSTDNPTVTPEEINLINIEIAKLLGATWQQLIGGKVLSFDKITASVLIPDACGSHGLWNVPNYYSSLDACASGFESRLTNAQQKNYITALWKTNPFSEEAHYKMNQAYVSDRIWWGLATATAPQRCEAFLRLHNKWPAGKV